MIHFRTRCGALVCVVACAMPFTSFSRTSVAQQCTTEELGEASGDSAVQDLFGASIGFGGGWAIVGAPRDDLQRGAAYVYRVDASGFPSEQKLTAEANATNNDQFGFAVDTDGDLAIVGAINDDGPGTANVYRREDANWVFEHRLTTGGGGAANADFGTAVSIRGNLAAVGASGDSGGGAVYVFRRANMTWTLEQRITNVDGSSFGRAVDVDGDRIAIGGQNQAFVYRFEIEWTVEDEFEPVGNENFGISIDLDGAKLVIGASTGSAPPLVLIGLSYVYRRDADVWVEEQKLQASNAARGDRFGASVALDDDTLLVTAPSAGIGNCPGAGCIAFAGAAYSFSFDGANWTEQAIITATPPTAGAFFGAAVALDGSALIIGAATDPTVQPNDPGSAFLFGQSFCFIDNECVLDGDANPDDPCEECNVDLNPEDWTAREEGAVCGNASECSAETCQSGVCTPGPRPAGTECGDPSVSDCDLPDECDGAGNCDANLVANGEACTIDGNECTDNVCDGGICTHPPLPMGTACGDQNPMDPVCDGPDECDGAGTCDPNWALNGTDCNDASFCNGDQDACDAGICMRSGDPCTDLDLICDEANDTCVETCFVDENCDDGIDCTADTCELSTGECFNEILPGTCLIDNNCFADGARNPRNDCEECNSAMDSEDWSFVMMGGACGNATDDDCDNPDTCDGDGVCMVNLELDGTMCTDDGNDCTDDVCTSGVCMHPAVDVGTPCGNPTDTECDNPDSCDGSGNCLDNHEPDEGLSCNDDGNQCTSDVCANGLCTHPPLPSGAHCGDPTITECDLQDTCDGAGGCSDNFQPAGTPCGDASSTDCDGADQCDGAGACDPNVAQDGTPCEDATFCNGAETCLAGDCQDGSEPCANLPATPLCDENADTCVQCLMDADCDDGNVCTTDTCTANACNHEDNTLPCADGQFCNGTEVCAAGECQAGTAPCTGQLPMCDESTDTCVECLDDTDCADDTFCNGDETCDAGECIAGTDPCTAEQLCDEDTDACVQCLDDSDCDDKLFCNGEETCASGACVAGTVPCSAGEFCVESGGGACLECRNGTDCDDGDPCTADRCPGGACDNSVILPGCLDDDDDGVPNSEDVCEGFDDAIDSDGDGTPDGCDPCPQDALDDADNDGFCANDDNCPTLRNPAQADADADGIGDLCDDCPDDPDNDADLDGICGDEDNCPAVANEAQEDADGDGIGDACDECPLDADNDADRDGLCGNVDNCPLVPNPAQIDTDGDGLGDACDPCPNDPNPDADEDGDGICGNADLCPGTPAGETVDANGCSASQIDDDGAGAEVPNGNDNGEGTGVDTPICGIFGVVPFVFTMVTLAAVRAHRRRRWSAS